MRSLWIALGLVLFAGYGGLVSAQPDYILEASVDNATPYVGQPVIYTVRLYQQREAENVRFQPPAFSGFGQSLDDFVTQNRTSRNGQMYRVTEQQRVLYPAQTGQQTIAPFQVRIPETPFQPGADLATDSISLTVQPLPADAPADFSNAIGQYDVQASTDKTVSGVGQVILFRVQVSGSGNLEQVNAPDVAFPAGVDVFRESPVFVREAVNLATKSFRWSLVPRDPGTLTVASVQFTFFNPQTATYTTRRTAPVSVQITAEESAAVTVTPRAVSEPVATSGAPVTASEPNTSPDAQTVLNLWPVLLVSGLLLAGCVMILRWMFRETRSDPPRRTPDKPSRKISLRDVQVQLKQAAQMPPKDAHQQIEQLLLDYLSTRTGQPVTRETVEQATAHLPQRLQRYLIACLNDAGSRRYAPVDKQDVQQLVHRVNRVIQAMERL